VEVFVGEFVGVLVTVKVGVTVGPPQENISTAWKMAFLFPPSV